MIALNQRHGEPPGFDWAGWLRQSVQAFPEGWVHLWRDGEIVGQLELILQQDPRCGYVLLFYLVPHVRGTGLSTVLHDYAVGLFRRHGMEEARLSVSPTNARHRVLPKVWLGESRLEERARTRP